MLVLLHPLSAGSVSNPQLRIISYNQRTVAGGGFEPPTKDPETFVIPFHHPAKSLKRGEYKQGSKGWQQLKWINFSELLTVPNMGAAGVSHAIADKQDTCLGL